MNSQGEWEKLLKELGQDLNFLLQLQQLLMESRSPFTQVFWYLLLEILKISKLIPCMTQDRHNILSLVDISSYELQK